VWLESITVHSGRHYSLRQALMWTRRETAVFLLIALVPTALYDLAGWRWLATSWLPIALVGTAVAFITGFKNSASYARLWEARQIWGAIVNSSRTFALHVLDAIPDDASRRQLLHRHVAWLTALRYQLREQRPWETMGLSYNREYRRHYHVAEWEEPFEEALSPWLAPAEAQETLARRGRATFLLQRQVDSLRQLAEPSVSGELRHLQLLRIIADLTDAQGRCERIKNFPYPRQFATLNLLFVWLFVILVPFGLLEEFQKFGTRAVWLTVPFSSVIAWVFHTMDKIGDASENPFQGSPNDVPVTALARNIEIDLLELLGTRPLPSPRSPDATILM
jgi:ion channel-forming bestrophin family protein